MAPPLKDFVDDAVVADLADRFAAVDDRFDAVGFVTAAEPRLDALELKARIELIARQLRAALDDDYPTALTSVLAVARAEPPIGAWADGPE